MAHLFWLSDQAWAALAPHLPRGASRQAPGGRPAGDLGHPACAQDRLPHDEAVYRHRNRVERCFNGMKHFRRFATRYDRRAIHFDGSVHLAAAMIWLA